MKTRHHMMALSLLICTVLWAKAHAPKPMPMERPSPPKSSVPPVKELRPLFPPITMTSAAAQQDREEVAEVVFRTLMRMAPVDDYPCIFLSIDDTDPTGAFMQRFQGTGKWVFRKGSKHKDIESGFVGRVIDRETGQRGIRLSVHFLKQSPTAIVVSCWWMWGVHLGGGGYKTEFVLEKGHWREKRARTLEMWIS